jgi:gliding motility-associated-like protein
MKSLKVFFFLSLCCLFQVNAQIWNREYDKGKEEYSNSITILNNHLYINEINETDASILKLDLDGNFIQSITLSNVLRSSKLFKTSSNELIFLGTSKDANEDIVAIKLDADLNIIWTFRLSALNYQFPESGIENNNGDFTICGFSASSSSSTNDRDGIVFRLNSAGQLLWYKKHSNSISDYFSGIAEAPSGNMVLVGAYQGGQGLMDMSVTHINSIGDVIETYTWGGTQNDGAYSVIYHNNAYYVSGNTWSAGVGMQDMALLKIDLDINLVYAKTYGSLDIEPGLFVSKTSNGKIILAGQSSIPGKSKDICILLLEENGDIISMKNIGTTRLEEVGFGYQFIAEHNTNFYVTSSTISESNKKNIMLSKVDLINNDTCCNYVNNINFSSTNSNFLLLNSGFVSSSLASTIPFVATVNSSVYTTRFLCIPDTNLKTTISANAIHFCQGTPIQFNANSNLNNIIYHWNFNDPNSGALNQSIEQNPVHIFTAEGNFTVQLISKAECSVDTDYVNITIKGVSDLVPKILAMNVVYCKNDSVAFSASGNLQEASMRWEFGDPASGAENNSTLLNPKHLFSSIGTYKIYVIIENICGSDTDSVFVTIIDNALLNPSITSIKNEYCTNEQVVFLLNNTNPNFTFTWNFGDPSSGSNNTSNLQNPVHVFQFAGSYQIIVKVESPCTIEYDTISITIKEFVVINASIEPMLTEFCISDSVVFKAKSFDLNTSYQWDFGDPNSGTSNTSVLKNTKHKFSSVGSYLIILKSSNECNTEFDSLTIQIKSNAIANFNYELDTCTGLLLLTNTTENTSLQNYSWIINNVEISNAIDTFFKINSDGSYVVKLISNPNTNCSDSMLENINFKFPIFDSNLQLPNTFSPNNDGINDVYEFKSDIKCHLKKIMIYNRYGRILYESEQKLMWDGKINGNPCPVGTYILYLEFKDKIIAKTINVVY